MRVIFQNGEIAELNNVHSLSINNDLECDILLKAVWEFCKADTAKLPIFKQMDIWEWLNHKEEKNG